MLSLHHPGARLCDGWTRREWLRVGGLGAFGLTLPGLLAAREAQAAAGKRRGKARACIVLFFLGGPPQHDTWDPKPEAPAEIRGDLKPIATATPGLLVGELMPRTARLMDQIAILRAMHTGDNAHSSSGYFMTTGKAHQPLGVENAKPGPPNNWPSLGAVVRRLWAGPSPLPPAMTLPEQSANDGNRTWPGQDAGFLGRSADPWLLNCTPEADGFQVPGLGLPTDISGERFDGRRTLLREVNARLDAVHRSDVLDHYDARAQKAFDLISSSEARSAFDLGQEPARVRDRYGLCRFGQSCLLARRLVEAGVPFVRVNWTRVKGAFNNGHWDTHSKNTGGMKQLMPIMDRAYSALLEDLGERGLLDDTLVVWTGEFGRTPKINRAAGRDHWGHVFSVALAGGGVRGGQVIGSSDRIGGHPRDGRVLPPDLAATVLHCLGIPPGSEIQDSQGRPLPASRGQVIQGLF
jgi:Protein of unknown function (DUF1501)